ncbi:hypothetical protein EXIGLDRAFT_599304 [Exidia glandulosa HHB12029]|uniref:1-alkyl-2-acetylglycerophosphocholine esterase n=1 Tax=Exidia glandulosa HHB12029 TaxID=1314781 RepID=A0A165QKD8_EXIGL|nr:hypothetical protein EXIGLDRAFT_599304 [Exidia glandulosa HHB12029]
MFLPQLTGPYNVGLTTLVHDVSPPRKFGTAKLNGDDHVLEADAVVFNVFYPCDVPAAAKPDGAPWIDQPTHAAVAGTAHFTGVSQWAIWPLTLLYSSRLRIPVFEGAPLLKAKDGRWRVIIFSHGLAGSKTMYSQLVANLASQGYVVLALEHRDRSGMLFTTRDGQPRYYAKPDDIVWDNTDAHKFALRVEQLEFRRFEVYTAFSVLKDLVSGSSSVHKLDGGAIDPSPWSGGINCESEVVLAGHSFGACTLLSILSSPPLEGHEPIPFSQALALDPWFEPLATPGPMPSNWTPDIPLCVIDSEAFTIWKAHLAWAEELVGAWPAHASFFTFPKSKHETFSDVYCMVPFQRKKFESIFAGILSLSHAFVEDRLPDAVKQLDAVPLEIVVEEKKGKTTRSLKGAAGQIIIHRQ